MSAYRILYRGSLSSCNYGCNYCPFAKTTNSPEELEQDAREVQAFVDWVENTQRTISVFFTPWGEAIIHAYYRQAMVRLSQMPHVKRVVIQTNLSCRTDEFASGDQNKIALWTTYHPSQTTLRGFLRRCRQLTEQGTRYSVGVVGLKEHFNDLVELRSQLPAEVYLWVNAYKRVPNYYDPKEIEFLQSIDPHFAWNRTAHDSFGKSCHAGETAFTVDGRGDVRRCHFIDQIIANIFRNDVFSRLRPSACINESCGCHIGYVHLKPLKLDQVYGENLLERIPQDWPAQRSN